MNNSQPVDRDVWIIFTMDVELNSTGDGRTSGPATTAEGAQRIREYFDCVADYGYTPTYFVHPDIGDEQVELLLELRQHGASLGLHLHPVKFTLQQTAYELGGLTRDEQLQVMTLARDLFADRFGFTPTTFRPGCFSASDVTFSVLHELGFVGGSISIPGRIWPERCCVWSGAEPHPHYSHPGLRQLAGDMNFVNIPLSVARQQGLIEHPVGFLHYPDLRPGGVYSNDEDCARNHSQLLEQIIDQLIDDRPRLKTIVVDVHNDRNFTDIQTASAQQLRLILDGIQPGLTKRGLHPINGPFDTVIEAFRNS